jgi:DNA repair exonuclease SbcCD ATPase subunit
MRLKTIEIKNIGLITNEVIPIDKPLLLFYGDIMQGKTTILNAVKLCFGGAFPSDVIRHGEQEAHVQLTFDNAVIRREFYRNAAGEVTARPISFIRDGLVVKKPVEAIKEFLNPFLLDQNHLFNMTELERKRFFIDLFGVDTSSFDKEYNILEGECKTLRIEIKSFGELDLTPVELVDVGDAKAKIKYANDKYAEDMEAYNTKNTAVTERNLLIARARGTLTDIEAKLKELLEQKAKVEDWIQKHPALPAITMPAPIDTSALQEAVNNAAAQAVRYEQYQQNLSRDKAKKEKQRQLLEKEAKQRAIKAEKETLLKSISNTTGIEGLSFDEEGNFVYEGTQAGMLSTSQLMRLSSALSAKYPEGFGIELIDRGESLGKSIFEFVKRAEREERTILATIVGDKPADIPDNIGVFVVEEGKVKP